MHFCVPIEHCEEHKPQVSKNPVMRITFTFPFLGMFAVKLLQLVIFYSSTSRRPTTKLQKYYYLNIFCTNKHWSELITGSCTLLPPMRKCQQVFPLRFCNFTSFWNIWKNYLIWMSKCLAIFKHPNVFAISEKVPQMYVFPLPFHSLSFCNI